MKRFLYVLFFLPFLLHAGLVQEYASYPGEVAGSRATVSIDGQNLFVHKHPANEYDYVHFTFTGTVQIQVTGLTNAPKVIPLAANISPTVDSLSASPKTILTFTITKPGPYFVLRYDDSTKGSTITYAGGSTESAVGSRAPLLVIFAEAPSPTDLTGSEPRVYNAVTTYLISNTGASSQTTSINNAISGIAASGGGTLFFPKGVYLSGMIQMKDNVFLYLDQGACLQATTNIADTYGNFSWPEDGGEQRGQQGLVVFDRVKNSGIRGHGIIILVNGTDANTTPWNIRIRRSRNIQIKDIIIATKNVGNNVICNNSDFVEFKNYKGLNWIHQILTGGAPIIDSSRHVILDGCTGTTSDDCLQIQSRSPELETIRDIAIRNSYFWSTGAGAFRNGGAEPENYWDQMSEITFDHVQMLCGNQRSQIGASGVQRNYRFLETRFEVGDASVGPNNFGGSPSNNPWTLFNDVIFYDFSSRDLDFEGEHIGSNIRFQNFSLSAGPFASPTFTPITTNDSAVAAGCVLDADILFQ